MKLLCLDSNSIINRAFYGVKILTTKDGMKISIRLPIWCVFLRSQPLS